LLPCTVKPSPRSTGPQNVDLSDMLTPLEKPAKSGISHHLGSSTRSKSSSRFFLASREVVFREQQENLPNQSKSHRAGCARKGALVGSSHRPSGRFIALRTVGNRDQACFPEWQQVITSSNIVSLKCATLLLTSIHITTTKSCTARFPPAQRVLRLEAL